MSEKERRIRAALDTINDVNRTLKRKQVKNWGEFDALPRILDENEIPENMVPSHFNDGKSVLFATDRRLIFVKKRLFSSIVEEFPFETISSVAASAGNSIGELEIRRTDGGEAKFGSVPKEHLIPFAEYLKGRISSATTQQAGQRPTDDAPLDRVSKLDRLVALQAQGSISEEEFEAERDRILKGTLAPCNSEPEGGT